MWAPLRYKVSSLQPVKIDKLARQASVPPIWAPPSPQGILSTAHHMAARQVCPHMGPTSPQGILSTAHHKAGRQVCPPHGPHPHHKVSSLQPTIRQAGKCGSTCATRYLLYSPPYGSHASVPPTWTPPCHKVSSLQPTIRQPSKCHRRSSSLIKQVP